MLGLTAITELEDNERHKLGRDAVTGGVYGGILLKDRDWRE